MAATHDARTERKQASPERPAPRIAAAEAPSRQAMAGAQVARAGVDPGRPLSPGQVLQLQRTVGNRAVGQLLAARAAAQGVQRKRAYFKPKSVGEVTVDMATLHALAGTLDVHTEAAHAHVVGKMKKAADSVDPYKLAKTDFPASSDRRFTFWVEQLHGGSDSLKAASTGYMIEDIVTAAVGSTAGYTSQLATQGARPDFEITDGVRKGVVDVTSSGDIGHVLDKDFSLASYTYVVESLYPSIDFSRIATTALTVDDSAVAAMGAVRARRANGKLMWKLGLTRQLLRLVADQGKSMHGDAVTDAAYAGLELVASVTGAQGPTPVLLGELDKQIAVVNTSRWVQPMDTMASSLVWLQARYGVAGNPPWS